MNLLSRSDVILSGNPNLFTQKSKNLRAVSGAVSVIFAGIRTTSPLKVSVIPRIELEPFFVVGSGSTQSIVMWEARSCAISRGRCFPVGAVVLALFR